MSKFRLIVAGGRDFNNSFFLSDALEEVLPMIGPTIGYGGGARIDYSKIVILSGGANGADKLGELYAKQNGIQTIQYPAGWDKHGKAAGPIRNKKMAENADALVVFYDGKSRGTKNMIETANQYGIPVVVFRYAISPSGVAEFVNF